MARIDRLVLNLAAPRQAAEFYRRHLGMTIQRISSRRCRVGYRGSDAGLELTRGATEYEPRTSDRYWKIGVTLPDVDLAATQLRADGVAVSEPQQFRDIGYLCHLSDPAGFQIELLQHTFEGRPRTTAGDHNLPLGGGARVGQVTLRVTDLEAELTRFRAVGMRLLSIQEVADLDFTLYFLAFTEEKPPDSDLRSVGNREWLWQRGYTTLELQHLRREAVDGIATVDPTKSGYGGFVVGEATRERVLF